MQANFEAATVQDLGDDEVLHWTARVALWSIAVAVLACWLALVVLHLNDDYRVRHTQGVWIAVTAAASDGRWYPPVFDGSHYAGTRYMPLVILLNALASGVIGDPLVAGKLLAAILMATLLTLVVLVLRHFSCPWPLASALAAVVVATETGLQAGTTIGGDLLPVVLQVGAVMVTLRTRGRLATAVAGGLAGLAVASKLTALWALLAITTSLVLKREWRRSVSFAAACAGVATVVLGTTQLLTGGGLSENLLAFSSAGVRDALSFLRGPNQVLYNLLGHASGAVVLVPLAVLGALLSLRWRQLSIVRLALGYALLLLFVVYADVGTGFNQLLDVVVLTALAAGQLAGDTSSANGPMRSTGVLAVAVTVLWAASLDLVRTVGFDLRRGVADLRSGEAMPRAANVVASLIGPDEKVLAEDPSIYVALRRQPVVLDPFMVRRLDEAHPEQVNPLISWIAARRFDLVVLVVSLDNRDVDFWWRDLQFGARVASALRSSYGFDRKVDRYFLYRPLHAASVRRSSSTAAQSTSPSRADITSGDGPPAP